MFCSLINIEKINFFKERSTDYNPIFLYRNIARLVEFWYRWRCLLVKNSFCFEYFKYIDNLLVKKIKNKSRFSVDQRVKLEKNGEFLITERSQWKLK